MSITLHDRAPLEKVRKLADGRITAVAKFARTGCQTYSGAEVGRPDLAAVTVYRADDEVFSQDAMASFAHQAITLNHPADGSVSPANWSRTAVGFTEGRVARDGGFVEIPLMLADASAIEAYDSGRARELSAGYRCELVWGDGIAPDGTRYQAKQVGIRGNHIALVPAGRAGSECRIGDSAPNPGATTNMLLSDAERSFADTIEGRQAVDRARRSFEAAQAYRGGSAKLWDAYEERTAIKHAIIADECRKAQVAREQAFAMTVAPAAEQARLAHAFAVANRSK